MVRRAARKWAFCCYGRVWRPGRAGSGSGCAAGVPSLCVCQVVGQDLADDAGGERGVLRVVVQRADEDFHGFPDRPAASPGPGCLVDGQPFGEDAAALAGQKRPGDGGVAGRIADAAGAEVDDRAQPPVFGQQVARLGVAVEPDRTARPGGCHRRPPDLGGQRSVNVPGQRGERFLSLAVIDRQRAATEKLCGPGGGPPTGSIRYNAARNSARSAASHGKSPAIWSVSGAPLIHRYTDHGQGNPQPGSPTAVSSGIGSGNWAARTSSQCCSLTTPGTYSGPLGSRTANSSPRRNVTLSTPPACAGRTGKPAHRGNWVPTSLDTTPAVISPLRTSRLSQPATASSHGLAACPDGVTGSICAAGDSSAFIGDEDAGDEAQRQDDGQGDRLGRVDVAGEVAAPCWAFSCRGARCARAGNPQKRQESHISWWRGWPGESGRAPGA